jgi:UDP-N-acetylmuramate--alanine ligase
MAMHVYFSGIGGTGIGPLALIANDAGYNVSGSDKQPSHYVESLIAKGIKDIHIGQGYDDIVAVHNKHPIDWFVYSSALSAEDSNHPELRFVQEFGIKATKRDDFLNHILEDKNQKLIAIAGTHGKTTTTAMTIWLLEALGMKLSYSLGAKIKGKPMGHLDPGSEYFVYEADEYDRNFLSYRPYTCLIPGIDYDHPDTYPTRQEYEGAFVQFLRQCGEAVMWEI